MKSGRTTRTRLASAIAEALEPRQLLSGTDYLVNSLLDTVAPDGFLTLREAIQAANTNAPVNEAPAGSSTETDIIRFDPALFASGPATIRLSGSQLSLDSRLSIEGPGTDLLCINADGRSRVFSTAYQSSITLAGLRISGGNASHGGGLYNWGSLTVVSVTVSGNTASSYYGGGLYNDNGTVTMNNVSMLDNVASWDGGALYNNSLGNVTLNNVTIAGNTATQRAGGGLYNLGSLTMSNSTISSNKAWSYGGGVSNNGSMTMRDSTVSDNASTSYGSGGGLYNARTFSANDVALLRNSAIAGAGLSNDGTVSATAVTISGNRASDSGGGLVNAGNVTIDEASIDDNAANYGGGVRGVGGSLTIRNTNISRNSARYYGGGLYNSVSSSTTLTSCTFSGNAALNIGGGIYVSSSSATLNNCTFIGNSAYNGGGMYNSSSLFHTTLTNCTFSRNSASGYGGAMYNDRSPATLTNCVAWGNTAVTGSQIYNLGAAAAIITYSDIQGSYSGTGIIDSNPQFVRDPSPGPDGIWGTADDDYGDLRLRPGSPCINAGDNRAVLSGVNQDAAGQPRIAGGTVDIGAFEYPPQLLSISCTDAKDTIELTSDDASFSYRINSDPAIKIPRSLVTALGIDASGGDDLSFDLDLADLPLIIQSDAASRDQLLVSLCQSIASARNTNPLWSGHSLRTSSADALHGLAAILNQDAQGKRLYDSFSGQPVDEYSILVKLSINGDANLDGKLDASDYFLIDKGFLSKNSANPLTGYRNGDFNYDGKIDASDYFLIEGLPQPEAARGPARRRGGRAAPEQAHRVVS